MDNSFIIYCRLHPSKQAIKYCKKCKLYICRECSFENHETHNSLLQTLNIPSHPKESIINLKELTKTKVSDYNSVSFKCMNQVFHQAKDYCQNCKNFICKNCIPKHDQKHIIINLSEIFNQFNDMVDNIISGGKKNENKVEEKIIENKKQIEIHVNQIDYQKYINKINDYILKLNELKDIMINTFVKREKFSKDYIENLYEENEKKIKEKKISQQKENSFINIPLNEEEYKEVIAQILILYDSVKFEKEINKIIQCYIDFQNLIRECYPKLIESEKNNNINNDNDNNNLSTENFNINEVNKQINEINNVLLEKIDNEINNLLNNSEFSNINQNIKENNEKYNKDLSKIVNISNETINEEMNKISIPKQEILQRNNQNPIFQEREVIKEVPKEVIKEIKIEVPKEIIKEVQITKQIFNENELIYQKLNNDINYFGIQKEINNENSDDTKVKEIIVEKIIEVPKEVEKIVEKEVEKIIEVPKEIVVEKIVEVPKEVVVEKIVEVPKEVTVEKIVEVPKEVEKIVEKEVEKIVEVPKEVIVEKIVEVPKEVEKIVEKEVEKIVEVPKEVIVEKIVEVPKEVIVEKIVEVPKEVTVEKIVEVPKEVEKIVEVPKEVIVEKIVEVPKEVEKIVEVPKEVIVEKIVEKEVEKNVEIPKETINETQPKEVIIEKIVEVPKEIEKIIPKTKFENNELSKLLFTQFYIPASYKKQQIEQNNETINPINKTSSSQIVNQEERKELILNEYVEENQLEEEEEEKDISIDKSTINLLDDETIQNLKNEIPNTINSIKEQIEQKKDIDLILSEIPWNQRNLLEIISLGQKSQKFYVFNPFKGKIEEIEIENNFTFPIYNSYINILPYIYLSGGKDEGHDLNGFYALRREAEKKLEITKLPHMIEKRSNHSMIYIPNKKLILSISGSKSSVEKYDCLNKEWELLPNLSKPRERPGCTLINDYLYIFFGFERLKSRYLFEIERININDFSDWESLSPKIKPSLMKRQSVGIVNYINNNNNTIIITGGVNSLRNETIDSMTFDFEKNDVSKLLTPLPVESAFINIEFIQLFDGNYYNINVNNELIKFNKNEERFS